jgi:hypothetical protein
VLLYRILYIPILILHRFLHHLPRQRTQPRIKGIDEDNWRANNRNALFWKTDQNEVFIGSQIGYETYQHLLLKSDLISNDLQKVYMDDTGTSHTLSDNILEKIDMRVSSYNYVHWEKMHPMVHQLSRKISINSLLNCATIMAKFSILMNKKNHLYT